MQALIDNCNSGYIPAQICLVLSSASKAYGLQRAKQAGIPTVVVPKARFDTMEACQTARHEALIAANPDFIILAGFLGILPQETVQHFKNRILNIHPALIPSFHGKGMHGEAVHQAVLDYGVKVTGVTVHIVDEGVDTGPIVLQEAVPVLENDTAHTLSLRVLETEHQLLSLAAKLMAEERLVFTGRKVSVLE